VESTQAVRKFVSGRLLATREGTILVGVGAALLAAVIIFAYVNQYRNSLDEGAAPVSVLVARNLIETGTPGDVIASGNRFQVTSVPKDDVKPNAITDPASLTGSVAAHDIYPNQQLTLADFTPGVSTIGTQLKGPERAISLPVDATHGMIGQVQAGDHVDVYASFDSGVLKTLYQDVYVIAPPGSSSSGIGQTTGDSSIILRVRSVQAANLAYVADNGKLWIVLRPRAGAPKTKGTAVNGLTVLAGSGR
jgi:Flp pilus assembly protein CpaB